MSNFKQHQRLSESLDDTDREFTQFAFNQR